MNRESLKITTGILATTYAYNHAQYYATQLSNKIISALDLYAEVKQYFTTHYIVGMALSSQWYINGHDRYTPSVKFIAKSLVGFAYFAPAAIVAGTVEHHLKQYASKMTTDVTSILCGVATSAMVSEPIIQFINGPLNVGLGITNKGVLFTAGVFTTVIGAVAGEEPSPLVEAVDFTNSTQAIC